MKNILVIVGSSKIDGNTDKFLWLKRDACAHDIDVPIFHITASLN